MACTFGSIVKVNKKEEIAFSLNLPFPCSRLTILLVNSKPQNLEAQTQRVAELMNMSAESIEVFSRKINDLTNNAYHAFKQLYELNHTKLCKEKKNNYILIQCEKITNCIRDSQKLLQSSNLSHSHLNSICSIAQKHGYSGRYTDINNGRYAYIFCLDASSEKIASLTDELKTHGFDVMKTNLANERVRFE